VTAYSLAEANLPRLIDKALAGEQVIITRRGKPVVELRPAARQTAPATGTHERVAPRPNACPARRRVNLG
jgi:prevent-host-death family protein